MSKPVERVTPDELAKVVRFAESALFALTVVRGPTPLDRADVEQMARSLSKLAAEVTAQRAERDAVTDDLLAQHERTVDALREHIATVERGLESLREKARAVYDLEYNGAFHVPEHHMPAFDALGAEIKGAPAERTPETVLRAMLRAYEQAALDASVAAWRASSSADTRDSAALASAAVARADRMAVLVTDMRAALAMMIAGRSGPLLPWLGPHGVADYEARLRGDRPLDAPPGEV